MNRELAESEHLLRLARTERDRLRSALRAVAKLADDHDIPRRHNHSPIDTDPDCGACWVHDIRDTIAEHIDIEGLD